MAKKRAKRFVMKRIKGRGTRCYDTVKNRFAKKSACGRKR